MYPFKSQLDQMKALLPGLADCQTLQDDGCWGPGVGTPGLD